MYLPKLEQYSNEDWELFFKHLTSLSDTDKEEVKQILKLPTKRDIEAKFDRLFELGVTNGLGPWYFPKKARIFLGYILSIIDWRWHDISVALARNKKELLKADRGVKKYGFQSIEDATELREDNGCAFMLGLNFFVLAPLKAILVYIVYGLLRVFSRFSTNY